jgi:hypothetical protein
MNNEFIPIYSAAVSAFVAFLVAWLTGVRAARVEIDKIRLGTQQAAFAKLLEVRIREYPGLYTLLSDLPKTIEHPSTVAVDLNTLLQRVNAWDSEFSIFLGPETSNACYEFRHQLRRVARERTNNSGEVTSKELLNAAAHLELALRSDLGIHGIGVVGSDLSPRERDQY